MKINCPACGNEITVPEKVVPKDANERPAVAKPKSFEVERFPGGLVISRKWFHPTIIFLTFFCLFWNGFMAVWFSIAFKQKLYIMALFGTLHGAVGLGLLYTVLAGYFNKTFININPGSLTVMHRPLPWFGQKRLVKGDLKQFYSQEKTVHGEHGPTHTYSVQVLTRKGQVIELVGALLSQEEALFIEQEIEKYLKIDDEPVRGEVPRSVQ